ncbi:sigma-54 interaction domain-containing protein [Metabacillus sediminilitoris]|uniref:HTH-type transcriptional regulatory protein TyrR n=1 Tax=Metabacillus sediminilitoris TaxID=2567941 RepID=A0A4S4BPG2_9BACI|nr:sigma 54-interacting transcriptional regulator [Metabacillus sediminilitoris]QGQ45559.1 PAS domain-containing protein [Metabacillus sediminilitoris]THF76623.1 PAS domain-containing protein [Metabacillus sediminilitoris]
MNRDKIIEDPIESQILLSNLIDSLYDGITVTDPQGNTLWYNKAFLRISGLTPYQLTNYTSYELVEKGWLKNAAAIDVIKQKKTINTIVKYPTGIEALITSTPVFDNENNLHFVINNVRDITELNKLKRDLDETTALTKSYRQTLHEVQLSNVDGNQIIYRSPVMEKIVSLANKFAAVDTPILILGESGVGKDVLANYIHSVSDRNKKGPFVKVNCGAIPEHLLESELFGYEAGAFTGANRHGKAGLFEVANNGTIFLDEIGDMPYSLQVKLLGVLQDMKIHRVGSTKSIPINVKVIAATNANLQEMLKEKRFREDLFFRINVLSLNIPPLRERPEDIFVLLMHFLTFFNEKHRMKKTFSPTLIDLLLEYRWHGNIRELKNLVERLVIISDDEEIDDSLLPSYLRNKQRDEINTVNNDDFQNTTGCTLKEMVEEHEKKVLSYYISHYKPLKKCAEMLGMDLTTLFRKKKRYGL